MFRVSKSKSNKGWVSFMIDILHETNTLLHIIIMDSFFKRSWIFCFYPVLISSTTAKRIYLQNLNKDKVVCRFNIEILFYLYKPLSESFFIRHFSVPAWLKKKIHIHKITKLFSFLFTSQTIDYLIYSFNGSHAALIKKKYLRYLTACYIIDTVCKKMLSQCSTQTLSVLSVWSW